MTWRGRALAALVCAALAGCAARPAPAPRSGATTVTPALAASAGVTDSLVRRLQSRARDAQSGQRWAEAVTQWEVLVLLQPEEHAHRSELESAQQAARQASAVHLKSAEAARSRRNTEAAALAYLKALAADPRHAGAAAALKTLEAERAAKTWLTRPPRGGYTPPGTGEEPVEKR